MFTVYQYSEIKEINDDPANIFFSRQEIKTNMNDLWRIMNIITWMSHAFCLTLDQTSRTQGKPMCPGRLRSSIVDHFIKVWAI